MALDQQGVWEMLSSPGGPGMGTECVFTQTAQWSSNWGSPNPKSPEWLQLLLPLPPLSPLPLQSVMG